MGGYGEMTSMIGMERAGQPSGPSFLPSRCFGTTPDMLTGYAPTQPPPHVSIYCDADSGVLQPYGASAAARPSLDQFVNFDNEELASSSAAAAMPSGSFPPAMVSTRGSDMRSTTQLYNPYHHHHHHHLKTELFARSYSCSD